MALADDIAALKDSKPRTFDKWLRTATPEERDMVLDALRDVRITPEQIMNALRKNGIPMARETVAKYREPAN